MANISFLSFALLFFCSFALSDTLDRIRQRNVLLWGGDSEGGAPYSFPDPVDPSQLVGFEVEIAEQLALRLGVEHKMVDTLWANLPQALMRGDFDIILNGLEITPERRRHINFTRPYYEFHEALMVREENQDIQNLDDLTGKKVGTLKGTLASDLLSRISGVSMVLYEGNVEPYRDLALGRLDAVLMDYPIAHYYGEKVPGLKDVGKEFGSGFYAIGVRKEDSRLLEEVDRLLEEMRADGTLHEILARWGLLGDKEVQFQEERRSLTLYLPLLIQAAGMTFVLSVCSMTVAVFLGLGLCLARVYGSWPLRTLALAYIEFFRGTPLLLQLLIIYFGLPTVGITLPAWLAGMVGLGLNFAAYEAEIYRGGVSSVPAGQMEAALSLGMSRAMSVQHVILPQALRVSIPASTNDFISLFKDSSLCSVIGVMELTKQFNVLAVSTWRVMELGILTGVLYLFMSYPLSLLAGKLEARLGGGFGRAA